MLELLHVMGFVPRYVTWELTLGCNMNCRHCLVSAGKPRENELSTEEALRLCSDLAEAGCEVVTFTGGEPLLRKDWPKLAKALSDHEIKVKMLSNGELFSRDVAKQAADVGMKDICFSLDGLEENHAYIRQATGNWEKVLENCRICREREFAVHAITTVNKKNLSELRNIHRIMAENGVQDWKIQMALPIGNMQDYRDLLLESKDITELIPLIADLRTLQGPKVSLGHNLGYYGGFEEHMRIDADDDPILWIGCTAGCQELGIESNGNIKGCCNLPSTDTFVEGNIRKRPLQEIWNNPEAFSYNRRFQLQDLKGYCHTCDYRVVCRSGCVAAALAHTGTRYENSYCHRAVAKFPSMAAKAL